MKPLIERLRARERHFRKVILRKHAIAWLANRLEKKAPPDQILWGQSGQRILFLRYDRIGDMVISSGILSRIHEHFPSLAIDVLASPSNHSIIERESYINQVFVYNVKNPIHLLRLGIRLRRRHYDLIIDNQFEAASFTVLFLMTLVAARFRAGLRGRGIDRVYNLPSGPYDSRLHVVDNLARMLPAFGIEPDSMIAPRVSLSPDERSTAEQSWAGLESGHRILINVCAGRPHRDWQAENFSRVIAALEDRFPTARFLVMGIGDRQRRVESIAESANRASPILPGSIREAMAVVATANLVITPDTSIAHFCTAFRIPAVALYYQGNARTWGMYHDCCVCVEGDDNTVQSVAVDQVMQAVDSLLPFNELRSEGEASQSRNPCKTHRKPVNPGIRAKPIASARP